MDQYSLSLSLFYFLLSFLLRLFSLNSSFLCRLTLAKIFSKFVVFFLALPLGPVLPGVRRGVGRTDGVSSSKS